MAIDGVMLDLGGVVLGSPLEVFAHYETANGLPEHTLNRLVVDGGRDGAWSRFERGELPFEAFCDAFDGEARALGRQLDTRALMTAVAAGTGVRPRVVETIDRLREAGYRMAALTNNWSSGDQDDKMAQLRPHFDVFIESHRVGLRKPDPRIYALACERLQVAPDKVLFLDDIGQNLKSARTMGMRTVKVSSEAQVLEELAPLLDAPPTAR